MASQKRYTRLLTTTTATLIMLTIALVAVDRLLPRDQILKQQLCFEPAKADMAASRQQWQEFVDREKVHFYQAARAVNPILADTLTFETSYNPYHILLSIRCQAAQDYRDQFLRIIYDYSNFRNSVQATAKATQQNNHITRTQENLQLLEKIKNQRIESHSQLQNVSNELVIEDYTLRNQIGALNKILRADTPVQDHQGFQAFLKAQDNSNNIRQSMQHNWLLYQQKLYTETKRLRAHLKRIATRQADIKTKLENERQELQRIDKQILELKDEINTLVSKHSLASEPLAQFCQMVLQPSQPPYSAVLVLSRIQIIVITMLGLAGAGLGFLCAEYCPKRKSTSAFTPSRENATTVDLGATLNCQQAAQVIAGIEAKNQCPIVTLTAATQAHASPRLAVDIAIALVKQKKNVLLAETDPYKPHIKAIFDLPDTPGFIDFYKNASTLEEATHSCSLAGLALMNAGNIDSIALPQPSLQPLDTLRLAYDVVLLYCPTTPSENNHEHHHSWLPLTNALFYLSRQETTLNSSSDTIAPALPKNAPPFKGTIIQSTDNDI